MLYWILKMLAKVITAYVVMCVFIYFFQTHLIFFPSHAMYRTPSDVNLAFNNVRFHAEDGTTLHGWFVPAPNARAAVLFCHGNGGNISHRLDSIQHFHDLGLSVFIFDYRGYGQSQGQPTESGTYQDATAAWHYLTQDKGFQPGQLVFFGRSLGGSIAAWLAAQHPPAALILESSFTDIPALAQQLYPYLPARWLSRFQYQTLAALKTVHSPTLVIHSKDDELIPFEHGQQLFQAAPEPKRFFELQGGHNEGFLITTQYFDVLKNFLDTHLVVPRE